MVMTGSGRGSSGSANVSPMVMSLMPAMAMMSRVPSDRAEDAFEAQGPSAVRYLHSLRLNVGPAPHDLLALTDRPVARAQNDKSDPKEYEVDVCPAVARIFKTAPGCARGSLRRNGSKIPSSGIVPSPPPDASSTRVQLAGRITIGNSIWCSSASRS